MKTKINSIILLVVSALLFAGCGKSSTGGSATPAEENLSVKLSAAAIETALSNSFAFSVNVQSKLPAGGVTIQLNVKREDNSASVYNVKVNSSFASTSFTINPLPPGQIYCLASITVTSVTTPTNTWSGSFRVLWK